VSDTEVGHGVCIGGRRSPGVASVPSSAVSVERLQALLETAFPDASEVRVIDRGGGDHFEVRVTAPVFAGLTRVAQHRLVYAALSEPWEDGSIHELRINTKGMPQ